MKCWFNITRLGTHATVTVSGEILSWDQPGAQTGVDLVNSLCGVQSVEVILDSLGGSSGDALQVAERLQTIPKSTALVCRASSAAVTIALGCKRIEALRDAVFMVHSPCDYALGTPAHLRMRAANLETLVSKLIELYRTRTGQSETVVRNWFSGGDFYFTAAEAVTVGLADTLVEGLKRHVAQADLEAGLGNGAGTPDETALLAMLNAFGSVRIKNHAAFARQLDCWFRTRVVLQ